MQLVLFRREWTREWNENLSKYNFQVTFLLKTPFFGSQIEHKSSRGKYLLSRTVTNSTVVLYPPKTLRLTKWDCVGGGQVQWLTHCQTHLLILTLIGCFISGTDGKWHLGTLGIAREAWCVWVFFTNDQSHVLQSGHSDGSSKYDKKLFLYGLCTAALKDWFSSKRYVISFPFPEMTNRDTRL